MTVAVVVMVVAMAVEVMVMAVAVPMSVAVPMAMSVSMAAVAVATSDSRAIDRQRGRAQRENGKRRHNEFLGPCHGLLPICAARGSPCCDRNLDPPDAMRCDRGHASRCNAAASRMFVIAAHRPLTANSEDRAWNDAEAARSALARAATSRDRPGMILSQDRSDGEAFDGLAPRSIQKCRNG